MRDIEKSVMGLIGRAYATAWARRLIIQLPTWAITAPASSITGPPLVRALMDDGEKLESVRRFDDRREIETAIEQINATLDAGL